MRMSASASAMCRTRSVSLTSFGMKNFAGNMKVILKTNGCGHRREEAPQSLAFDGGPVPVPARTS